MEVDGKEAFETTLYLDDIGIWLTILCRWGDARHEALKDRKRLWHDYSLAACCSMKGLFGFPLAACCAAEASLAVVGGCTLWASPIRQINSLAAAHEHARLDVDFPLIVPGLRAIGHRGLTERLKITKAPMHLNT